MTRSIAELRAAAGIPVDAAPWEPTAAEAAELMFNNTRKSLNAATPPVFRAPIVLDARLAGWADSFAENPDATPSLLLLGPTGSGKTHNAYTLFRAAVFAAHQRRKRPRWRAVDHARFAEQMRPDDDGNHLVAFTNYRDADLLLFDDIGAALTREWGVDRFQALVDHRWRNQLPTIWTTNANTTDEIADVFGDRVVSRVWAGRRIAFGQDSIDHRRAQ